MTTLISQSHERAGTDLARISPSRITVARLRSQWKMANPDNRPLLVHADNTTKFVAAAGNSATGIRGAFPNVVRKKGAATIQSVNATNQLQIGLGLFSPASPTSDARQTPPPGEWLLLHFYEGENQELRAPPTVPTKSLTAPFRLGHVVRNSHLRISPTLTLPLMHFERI